MGPGRWDAEALAKELDCSVRTTHRILAVLAEAGVPFKFDTETRAYKVTPGYRFPGLDLKQGTAATPDPTKAGPAAKQLLAEVERFSQALREFCESLEV